MIKELENYLNCRQHLRDSIPMLIEAFVSYYGEERRKEIEEKFSHALYLAYRKPKTTTSYINHISEEISDEIIDKYLKESKTRFSKKELFEHSFQYENLQSISMYQTFYELYEMGSEKRQEKFKEESLKSIRQYLPEFTEEEYEEMIRTQTLPPKYNNVRQWVKDNLMYAIDMGHAEEKMQRAYKKCEALLHKVDPNITLENFSYYIDNEEVQELTLLARQKPAMMQEYRERMSRYSKFQQEAKEDEQIERNLSTEYYIKLIEENKDLLSEEDLESFEVYKRNHDYSFRLTNYIQYLFGYSLKSNHPLENFGADAEEIMTYQEKGNWKRDSIEKSRIEFFKKNGIDLGDDYDLYVASPEVQKIWPTKERVAQFIESRDRLLNEYNIAYYTTAPAHVEARKEIDELHFLDKDDSFNASIYTSSSFKTFVNPNIIRTDTGYQIYPLVVINCDMASDHIDHDIIHELNHVFELSLQSVDGNSYRGICGWDTLDGTINQSEAKPVNTLEDDDSKRPYELFNEIINEVIAQEIAKEMFEKGNYIFNTEENATYKNATSYEHTLFLVRDFFQEFKKEIIESRSNGNIEIIWNKVGKENFDDLNELFHIFFEHFNGYQYYGLIQSLQNNEENEKTRIYHDLVAKRDAILDKMRKHSMMHEETPQVEVEQEVK